MGEKEAVAVEGIGELGTEEGGGSASGLGSGLGKGTSWGRKSKEGP